MGGNGARSATAINRLNAVFAAGNATNIFASNAQTPAANPPAQPNSAQATPPSRTLDQFRQMNESELITYLAGLGRNVVMPALDSLPEFDTQRLVYDLGLNQAPTVVSDAEFNKIKGETFYRGVRSAKDSSGSYVATAQDIVNETLYGNSSRIGAGISGDGFYFGSKGTAEAYAGKTTGISNRDGAIMKMKVTGPVRSVTRDSLVSMFSRESRAVQRAFENMSTVNNEWSTGYLGAYALYKGYNAITRPSAGHYIVLDRSIITMSDKTH